MSLENKIMTTMKESMKSKNQTSLRSLRAIKSAIILQKTQKGSSDEISNEDELKILQKLVKQRKDSADIYQNQDRMDLAQPELDEIKIIEKFLPEALSEKEIEEVVKKAINDTKINLAAVSTESLILSLWSFPVVILSTIASILCNSYRPSCNGFSSSFNNASLRSTIFSSTLTLTKPPDLKSSSTSR